MTPSQIASALRQLAESFDALAQDAPDLDLYAGLNIQMYLNNDVERIETVDLIGSALLGKSGYRRPVCKGTELHYNADGHVGGLKVAAFVALDEKPEPVGVAS